MDGARHRHGGLVCESDAATGALRNTKIFHGLVPEGWRFEVGGNFFLTSIRKPSTDGAFCQRVLDAAAGLVVFVIWKQPSRNFLWKALLTVVWVADWHLQDGFLKSLEFLFRMCLDKKRHPSLKAHGHQAWYIRCRVIFFLHQMMRAFEVSIHL